MLFESVLLYSYPCRLVVFLSVRLHLFLIFSLLLAFTFYFSCRALTRKVLSSSYLCEASSAGLMPYRGDNFPKVSIRDFPTSSLSLLGLPYRPGLPEEGGVVVRDTCMNVQCCQRG